MGVYNCKCIRAHGVLIQGVCGSKSSDLWHHGIYHLLELSDPLMHFFFQLIFLITGNETPAYIYPLVTFSVILPLCQVHFHWKIDASCFTAFWLVEKRMWKIARWPSLSPSLWNKIGNDKRGSPRVVLSINLMGYVLVVERELKVKISNVFVTELTSAELISTTCLSGTCLSITAHFTKYITDLIGFFYGMSLWKLSNFFTCWNFC